jgi:Fe-S-cluster containining protein
VRVPGRIPVGCGMDPVDALARDLAACGFRCTGCGRCCRGPAGDANLVLVGPAEIRRIMDATGLTWEEIAVPYPEFLDHPAGCRYTLAWCLRRDNDRCAFLGDNRCTIYDHRPWICRTYPFMLEDGALIAFECEGIGDPMDDDEAHKTAELLLARKHAEDRELHRTERQYAAARFPPAGCVVIDSEGMKVLHD